MKYFARYMECARCDFFCLSWEEMHRHVEAHYRGDKETQRKRKDEQAQRDLQPGEWPCAARGQP